MQTTRIQPYTVMVVEDEATLSERCGDGARRRRLPGPDREGRPGCARRSSAGPPDAIVLDLMLPNVDGWQVVKWCRAHPTAATIPIIVVSAA